MNIEIVSICPGETCGKLAISGRPTDSEVSHDEDKVSIGDIFTEDEFDKLGHKSDCPFHRGEICDFRFAIA